MNRMKSPTASHLLLGALFAVTVTLGGAFLVLWGSGALPQ